MKYPQLVIALLASVLVVSNQFTGNSQVENADISIHIEGYALNWIYLQDVHKNVKSRLDSAFVNADGNAAFRYSMPLDRGYYDIVISEDISFPILLDDDQSFSLGTHIDQLIESMVVTGSVDNTLLYTGLQHDFDLEHRFQAEVAAIMDSGGEIDQGVVNQLRAKYLREKDAFLEGAFTEHPHTLFSTYARATQDPEILYTILNDASIEEAVRQRMMLIHYWDNVDFSDMRLLHTPVIYDRLWQYFNAYVPDQTDIKIQAIDVLMEIVLDHPAYYEFFATWVAEEYMPPYTAMMDPEAIYVHMIDHYLTKERAFWADSTQLYAWQFRVVERRVNLVGMKAGNIEACDPEGKIQSLYDVQSPYVALFFFHYDCDHCIEETPKLIRQYQELKDQGLEVFAVAMDTPEGEWKKFIAENDLNWINVTDEDNQDIYDHYFVRATPEITLLNPDRKIIGKHLAADDVPVMIQLDQMGLTQKQSFSYN